MRAPVLLPLRTFELSVYFLLTIWETVNIRTYAKLSEQQVYCQIKMLGLCTLYRSLVITPSRHTRHIQVEFKSYGLHNAVLTINFMRYHLTKHIIE